VKDFRIELFDKGSFNERNFLKCVSLASSIGDINNFALRIHGRVAEIGFILTGRGWPRNDSGPLLLS